MEILQSFTKPSNLIFQIIGWYMYHDLKTLAALLAVCVGNPSQAVQCFLAVKLNKLLTKPSCCQRFEAQWRLCDITITLNLSFQSQRSATPTFVVTTRARNTNALSANSGAIWRAPYVGTKPCTTWRRSIAVNNALTWPTNWSALYSTCKMSTRPRFIIPGCCVTSCETRYVIVSSGLYLRHG